MSTTPFTIEVTPNAGDAIASSWHALRGRPGLLAVLVGFFVILPWCVGVADVSFTHGLTGRSLQLLVIPLVAIVTFAVGIPLLVYSLARRSPGAGRVVHQVSADGITSTGVGWNRTIEWFDKYVRTTTPA